MSEPTGVLARGLTQKAAARLLGVSVSYLRASTAPRLLLPGNGPRGQPMLRYDPVQLLAWRSGWRSGAPQDAPQSAMSVQQAAGLRAEQSGDKSAGKSAAASVG